MSVSPNDSPLLAIFDHDGVLVDSLDFHQQAWLELGRRENLPITADFIRETFGMTNPSIFRKLLGESIDAQTIANFGDIKEECYRDLARPRIQLIDGVRSFIDSLTEKGFTLAIGSSGVRKNLELTAEVCGLSGRFASMAALEDIRHGKPDPEVFLVAAKRAGIEPKHAVVFEDATFGIQAAKSAGMLAVGVTTTNPADVLYEAGADDVVDTLGGYDVDRLIRRIRERHF